MNESSRVDSYIDKLAEPTKSRVILLRDTINSVAGKYEQDTKWNQPAFFGKTIIVVYGGHKEHVALYVTYSTLAAFKDKLKGYKTGKGSVQFPNDKELPIELIKDMVAYRMKEFEDKGVLWL